ncbi:hypothetical protein JQ594_25470 [Bradyrhizobium manausense]|uniref:hypothetical protein n=1 Tax=Bradyrhizobium manausense TaxID=989370 RepID=UPI001BA84E33|nr:hypothetical protein [Bradyrhizobium manausense]MBR0689293.1 hypothetical protein [Bradyrhizobium manausense]MBR0721749.1 hypothetical protein [Bradyrhizobium manausense]
MTKMKLLGAAAIAATIVTGSAMAQTAVTNSSRCAAQPSNVNCQNLGANGYRHHRVSYRQSNGDWNRTHTGFWPTDVAGDVAGAAIGTAGAIATAPFRAMDNSYAYDNSWDNRGWDTRSYAERNGFVCTPGTWFKGGDGRRHICQ